MAETKPMWEQALDYLYKEIKKTKVSIGHAERKPGVTQQELDDLNRKAEILELTAALVLKEGEE